MGKIVKFCSECEEGFAEKFGFCPNCGHSLEAFEMNPLHKEAVKAEAAKVEAAKAEIAQPETPALISSAKPVTENKFVEEPQFAGDDNFSDDDVLELDVEGKNDDEVIIDEPETKREIIAPAAATAAFSSNGNSSRKDNFQTFANADVIENDVEDDGFHVTVIEEKNVKQRNQLLLGSFALMIMLLCGGFIYSLFAKDLDLAAIGNDEYIASLVDDVPMPIEDEEPPKPSKEESGGGGGGGREEQTETSKGRLATQMREPPIIQPTKTIVQKDFELKSPIATTQGDKKIKPTEENYGNPNSTNAFGSDGRGRGGGQGEGDGTGQGNGRGTGAGNGTGSGFGNGDGDGIGDGTGSGRTRIANNPPPADPPSAGPSKALNITFKPKPKYTDEARQSNITGVVRVRVTFLANGSIGSVSPVSNLGYGLTEQAIAAAKQMRFEPQLVNGKPQTVNKVVVFNFTIY